MHTIITVLDFVNLGVAFCLFLFDLIIIDIVRLDDFFAAIIVNVAFLADPVISLVLLI